METDHWAGQNSLSCSTKEK